MKVTSVVKVIMVGPIAVPSGEGDDFIFKIEILNTGSKDRLFEALVWRLEHYRVEPSFPRRESGNRFMADEVIAVRDVAFDGGLFGSSVAEVEQKALDKISEIFDIHDSDTQ
jgi:hypothetical protein